MRAKMWGCPMLVGVMSWCAFAFKASDLYQDAVIGMKMYPISSTSEYVKWLLWHGGGAWGWKSWMLWGSAGLCEGSAADQEITAMEWIVLQQHQHEEW